MLQIMQRFGMLFRKTLADSQHAQEMTILLVFRAVQCMMLQIVQGFGMLIRKTLADGVDSVTSVLIYVNNNYYHV